MQSSIYARLKKTHGNKSGAMAWLLVRLGQPDHDAYQEAFDALSRNPSALSSLLVVARATAAAPVVGRRKEARELAEEIVTALESLTAAAGVKR